MRIIVYEIYIIINLNGEWNIEQTKRTNQKIGAISSRKKARGIGSAFSIWGKV